MAATKLLIYNNALHILGERRLSNIYEDREPRYVLDEQYNLDAIDYLLEIAQPRFAVTSAALTSPVTSSVHGIDEVYTFPGDWVSPLRDPGTHGNIASFFADEDFQQPVNRYILESNTVATEVATTLYVRYITNSRSITQFTPNFARLVSAYLAKEVASRINPSAIEHANEMFQQALANTIAIESVKENDFLPQKAAASLSTDQLKIYNLVAAHLGQQELRYIDDESALRLAIDNIYDLSRDYAMVRIKPRFATKTATLSSGSPSAVHAFDNVFAVPADYLDIVSLFSDEEMSEPITRYFIEDNNIAIRHHTTAVLRYIANDAAEADWSAPFAHAVAAYMAMELAPRFAPDLLRDLKESFRDALQASLSADENREPLTRPLPSIRTLTNAYRALYNKALEILELDPINSNDDESERKIALDYALDNKAVETVFELIAWDFPIKSVKLEYDTSVTPEWGYQYAFAVPSDLVRIESFASDEYFRNPVNYLQEGDYYFCDENIIYLKYVANTLFANPDGWPTYIFNLVAAEMARRSTRLPGTDKSHVEFKYQEYKEEAYNTDAQRNSPQVITEGNWNRARYTWDRRHTRRP